MGSLAILFVAALILSKWCLLVRISSDCSLYSPGMICLLNSQCALALKIARHLASAWILLSRIKKLCESNNSPWSKMSDWAESASRLEDQLSVTLCFHPLIAFPRRYLGGWASPLCGPHYMLLQFGASSWRSFLLFQAVFPFLPPLHQSTLFEGGWSIGGYLSSSSSSCGGPFLLQLLRQLSPMLLLEMSCDQRAGLHRFPARPYFMRCCALAPRSLSLVRYYRLTSQTLP